MTRPRRPADIALVVGTGVVSLLAYLMVRDSLTDDAFIALDYARNLALHLHWGLIPHEVANTATSPVNVVLLAAVTAAIRVLTGHADAVAAVGVVAVASGMLLAWGWTRIVRALALPYAAAAVGIALVVADPLLLSAVGLEVLLVPAVLTLLVATALEERAGWFGVVAGLALLTRLDLVVFVVAIAAFSPAIRRRLSRALIALGLIAGPWFLFSWLYFGSAIPDTLLIKTSQGAVWREWSFFNGPLLYTKGYAGRPYAIAIAFAPAVLGVGVLVAALALRRSARWAASESVRRLAPAIGLGAGGVAYYLVLSALHPGPYHWYYVPPIASLSIFLAIATGAWLEQERGRSIRRAAVPAAALGVAALLALGAAVRDVREGLPWRSPVITSNFADARDYERVGKALRGRVGGAAVETFGEIGTLAYYCECELVEVFSHRGYLVRLVDERIHDAAPVIRQLLQLNYLWLDRDRRLPRLAYRLAYARRTASGPDVWPVSSHWQGPGHIRLIALPGGSLPGQR